MVNVPHIKIQIFHHKSHRFMFIDDYLWMWDTPQEIELQQDMAKRAFGNVLVAGYGFGILQKFLIKNPKVKSVTTVEKYKEVIEQIGGGNLHGKIIISDFYDLPENKKFDCIIGDIWPDIDVKFLQDYIKFRNKSKKLLKKNGKILAWGKDYFEFLLKRKQSSH
ncbi:MAG: hypothetical protein HY362_04885 [Candidatus Aenigmarchaeota archaeon]|nr:hypothetical protein [Candidatus Aenigmarchaeota archaeon]